MTTSDFKEEWCLLQNQFDSYENHSLLIKLTSIVVATASCITDYAGMLTALIVIILWGQDAIWKTFQSRVESRLLLVERSIGDGSDQRPFQFNSRYQQHRLSGMSLVREYLDQAIRPTIAFPHLVLLPVLLINYML